MRVALLEDDPEQSAIVGHWLHNRDMNLVVYETGGAFLRHAMRENFDAYVLDWNLPDMSGIDVLRKIRGNERDQYRTPVLFATVVGEESAIVHALEHGADDYMVKPLRENEMMARLFAIRRRAKQEDDVCADLSPFTIDKAAKRILCHGEEIELTTREYQLARLLLENAGRIVSRKHIQERIWNNFDSNTTIRSIDTHISRLRKRLWSKPENGWRIKAIYQHGYRLERTGPVTSPDYS